MKYEPDSIECDSARLQASAWIDGELPASKALGTHLDHCDACRLHVEELRTLSARLAPLRAGEPAADLWPGIAARAGVSARPAGQWNPRTRRIAAALIGCAGMAALLEAASLMERSFRDKRPASHAAWLSALDGEPESVRDLRSAPEQQLLASIDPTQK